jgi:hypothetical protein
VETNDFQEDVTVKKGEFKDFFPELNNTAEPYLKKHFNIDSIPVYSVERSSKGLVRPVNVIKVDKRYYVFRAYEKNPPNLKLASFDRAMYQKKRVEALMKMGRFYPKTIVMDDDNHIYILNEFLFHSICHFTTRSHVMDLFKLQLAASKAGLFLDFNQNHWLYDKKEERLYYVDKDLIKDDHSFKEAIVANFSQSLLFLTKENYSYYIDALKDFKNGNDENQLKYVQLVTAKLEKNISELENREKTSIVKERLIIYQEMINQLKI